MAEPKEPKPIVLTSHLPKHESRFSKKKKRRDDPVNPLRSRPDYRNQRHTGSAHTAAINSQRIYFVDEDGKKLQPSAESVHRGDNPARFKGILDERPLIGEKLISPEGLFEVVDVRHELRLSTKAPPKIFIVLRPIK